MFQVMKKSVLSKTATLLLSIIFLVANTGEHQIATSANPDTNSYNASSFFNAHVCNEIISESNEEEVELDSFHHNLTSSLESFYIEFPITISSEHITIHLRKPISNESLERPKNRAPPISFI